MRVCNVKVKFIRPQYNDLIEWCSDCNNVYIGRRGVLILNGRRYPEKDSIWANPFKLKGNLPQERQEVLDKYYHYILEKIHRENLWEELRSLKDKNLGCWCWPSTCHGDVLVYIIKHYNL